MARKNVERFYTDIKQEGEAGATRGKVPVGMARAMGAKDGSKIEWEVVNGDCVGGHVMTKSEVKEWEREQRAAKKSSPPPRKPKGKVKSKKPAVKSSEDRPSKKKGQKKGKKLKKPSKRATKVSYESEPRKKGKKLKKPSFKVKKGRR